MKNLTDFCKTVKPVWDPRLEINRVVDSCFALIKIHQHNLAGSFYKTDLISHIYVLMTSNETRLIMQTIFILLSDRFL